MSWARWRCRQPEAAAGLSVIGTSGTTTSFPLALGTPPECLFPSSGARLRLEFSAGCTHSDALVRWPALPPPHAAADSRLLWLAWSWRSSARLHGPNQRASHPADGASPAAGPGPEGSSHAACVRQHSTRRHGPVSRTRCVLGCGNLASALWGRCPRAHPSLTIMSFRCAGSVFVSSIL